MDTNPLSTTDLNAITTPESQAVQFDVQTGESAATDWLSDILKSELFLRIPPSNLQRLMNCMEEVRYHVGDIVLRQGASGDYYYIVKQGRCEVIRETSNRGHLIKLAELKPGEAFGGDALVGNLRRNATIRMVTEGSLVRISRPDFMELVIRPLLKGVSFNEACEKVRKGAVWLDVRFPEERRDGAIPDSINVPLNILRIQWHKLDPYKEYVVCCDNGGRSSVAAFLLIERGLDACYVAGGCASHFGGTALTGVAPARSLTDTISSLEAVAPSADWVVPVVAHAVEPDPPSAPGAKPGPAAASAPATAVTAGASTMQTKTTTGPLVDNIENRLSAERVRLSEETNRAAKLIADVKRLKADLEAQRNFLVAENERRQKEMDTLVQRARADAELRYRTEKAGLEAACQQKQDELDKALALKAEAEESLIGERQKFEAEKLELQQRLSAIESRAKDESGRAAADEQLAEMRQILETEFARNSALVELARQERAAAETSRRAVSEQAEALIREYRGRYDRLRNQEEARLREERRLIESERESLRLAMDDALKARDEADAARRRAEEQAARLRAQQMSEIDAIESEALAAARRLREREQSEGRAQPPREDDQANQALLERTYDFQNQLRKQLQRELDEWLSTQNPGTVSPARILEIQQQNIDRIKKKAEEIRTRAQSTKLDFDVSGTPEPAPPGGAATG